MFYIVSEDGPASPTLQQVVVPFVDYKTCSSRRYYGNEVFEDTMVCAGTRGKDSCQVKRLESGKTGIIMLQRGAVPTQLSQQ